MQQTVGVKDIKVGEDRFGGEQRYQDMDLLVESVKRFGILEPILLQPDNTLVAGYRRLTAAQIAGLAEVPVRYLEQLSLLDHRRIELEENIMRLDLEWTDRCEAIAEIDRIKSAEDPTWNREKTAQLLGVSQRTVYNSIELQKAIEEDPTIKEAKTLVGAFKQLETKKALKKRQVEADLKRRGLRAQHSAEIREGDALELIASIPDGSIDAIVTNPPFGVSLIVGGKEVYEDDEDAITNLLIRMVPEWYRVLRDDSWLLTFFDLRKITYSSYARKLYDQLKDGTPEKVLAYKALGLAGWLEEFGFSYVTLLPLIWAKPNKTQGIIGNPDKGFIVSYEAFILAAKGNPRLLKQGKQNLFIYNTPLDSERVHPLQMPFDLCKELVGMVALAGETVLDTFAGSGSIGVGALQNQCDFIGFELDPEKARNGNTLLTEHTSDEPPAEVEEVVEVEGLVIKGGFIYKDGKKVGKVGAPA